MESHDDGGPLLPEVGRLAAYPVYLKPQRGMGELAGAGGDVGDGRVGDCGGCAIQQS